MLYLHGIQSHGGWYVRSSIKLAEAGYEVIFPDRRGSGWNTTHRGDTPSYRRLIADLGEFLLAWPRIGRRAIVSVSWGGKLGVALAAEYPSYVDGLALIGPGFFPKVKPSWPARWQIVRSRLRDPQRHFPIPLNDPELFTASPQWQRFIAEDRFALRSATARFLVESVWFDRYVRRAARRVTVPVLLQLAGQDRIIDNARTRGFLAQFGSRYRKIFDYPMAHHTMEFDSDDPPFLHDLRHWLDQLGGTEDIPART